MKFDALQFCEDKGIEYWTGGKNVSQGWVNIQCPMCSDNSNHGGFNPAAGYYSCWKCGGHRIEQVIMKLLSIRYKHAKELLYEYSGDYFQRNAINKNTGIKKIREIIPPGSEGLHKYHRKYIEKRGYNPDELAKKYALRSAPPLTFWNGIEYSNRVIIPILDSTGKKCISFQGRDITGKDKIRYKGCPNDLAGMNYKETLYNLHNCYSTGILVLEGVADVWRMGDNSVCTFGTSMKKAQLRLLSQFERVFFLFDPEPEAQAKARSAAVELAAMGVVTEVMRLDNGKDAGELSEKEAAYIKKQLFL